MRNVLILGAGGNIARRVVGMLAKDEGVSLTLFVRDARRLDIDIPVKL